MKSLTVRLFAQAAYAPASEIELVVEITNQTETRLLLSNDLLRAFEFTGLPPVPVNGKPEKGKKKATRKEFSLSAGRSVLKKVNLGVVPGINEGVYELVCRPRALVIKDKRPSGKGSSPTRIRTPTEKITLTIGTPVPLSPFLPTAAKRSLEVLQPGFAPQTTTEFREILPPLGMLPARMCRVIGGNAQQQSLISEKHEEAYGLVAEALQRLQNDQRYRTWFGAFEDGRFRRVRSRFQQIVDGFQHEIFTYDLNGGGCGDDEEAVSNYQDYTIKICRLFWNLPTNGPTSMAGRLVHEHSHVSADTVDTAYSSNDCLSLATQSPGLAVGNAATYQYYVET